jgi:hypothetical protein
MSLCHGHYGRLQISTRIIISHVAKILCRFLCMMCFFLLKFAGYPTHIFTVVQTMHDLLELCSADVF